jgi:hypothetical protein
VSRIGSDGAQGFAGGAEQNAIHHLLVLIGHVGDRLRHGKNHMEILHREQLRLAVFEPLRARQRLALGTMAVAAGIISDTLVTTGVTPFQVAAQGCAAAAFDSAHRAALATG